MIQDLEKHWLKSRYLLKSRNNELLSPLDVYDKNKAEELLSKAKVVLENVEEFISKKFEI